MIRFTKEQREAFMKKQFITCKKCGYNNKISRFENYGTCLLCEEILDRKTYFKANFYKTKHYLVK